MKKSELEQENKALKVRCERLARLLRSTQARGLGGIRILKQGLHVDDSCEETGSEQVSRCEDAMMRTLAYLARIVDPAALTQEQADQRVLQLRERDLELNDALNRYREEVLGEPISEDMLADVLAFMEKAMGKIALYTDDPDERSDISPLTEAWGMLCDAVALAQSTYYGNGSLATEHLASLIEAAEDLISNMMESGEVYDDHEQEETYGQLYPDVQRLMASIARGKEYLAEKKGAWWPVYRMPYPDESGRALRVHSMGEFDEAVLKLCAIRFASPESYIDFQEALERGVAFANRVDFIGSTVDMLIPDRGNQNELLTFVAFNQAFFTAAPEFYAYTNSLAPVAIVYEQLYQHTFTFIEDNLDEILQLATLLLAERQCLEEQLTEMNQCGVCGQEPCTWFWDPFASANPLLVIEPERTSVPFGAIAIGDQCKSCLEKGELLSFPFGGQSYQARVTEEIRE
jgi:hypothetical protein